MCGAAAPMMNAAAQRGGDPMPPPCPCCLSRARRRPHPAEPAAVQPRRCRARARVCRRLRASAPLRARARRGRLKQVRAGVGSAAGDGQRARAAAGVPSWCDACASPEQEGTQRRDGWFRRSCQRCCASSASACPPERGARGMDTPSYPSARGGDGAELAASQLRSARASLVEGRHDVP